MDDKTTRPLPTMANEPLPCNFYGWHIELSPDGLGLIVIAPEGKRLSMVDKRFIVSDKGRRLEVRAR